MAEDGDFGPSRQDVYDINKLSSDDVPPTVIDKHLKKANGQVAGLLKTKFDKDATPSFSEVVINSADLYPGINGSILYLAKFEDYQYLQSITAVSYRSNDSSSYQTFTEGMNNDYNLDLRAAAIKFNTFLTSYGYNNLQVSGTYGYKSSEMPDWMNEFIALIAALQGVVYASGGAFKDINSYSIGDVTETVTQYGTNLTNQAKLIKDQITEHMKDHGVTDKRSSVDII